ncbi:MAG: glycoside hydrolase family 43 protein, partial [Bacteroidales bacterium]|nr:glycoside hydrolase family 43 protein [Bacteroidales bacterium]
QVEVKDLEVRFSYGESLGELRGIGEVESMVVLADLQGNALFNGPGIGIYATSNGKASESIAGFDWFYYSAADL